MVVFVKEFIIKEIDEEMLDRIMELELENLKLCGIIVELLLEMFVLEGEGLNMEFIYV